MKDIIRKGDGTSHGGTVLEGFGQAILNGRPISGIGHSVSCPKCKGVFPIVEGSTTLTVNSTPVALEGMHTACGASLIASAPKGSAHG